VLGYRHLPLYNIQGEQYLFSRLFVKIDIDPMIFIERDFVPRASAIASIKSTAKSVLGFATDRRSVSRKSDKEKTPDSLTEGVVHVKAPQPPQEIQEDSRLLTLSPTSCTDTQGSYF
jgi:hypothetical protein